MTAHAEAHHGPPIANQSSRVDSTTLGMLLFIASEIMLFGSFFTVYFFCRVVADPPVWPPVGFHLPVFVAGVNTVILLTSSFTMHWALQAIKRGNRAGMQAGLVLTLALGLTFLLTQAREYSRIGFAPSDGAFGSVFFGSAFESAFAGSAFAGSAFASAFSVDGGGGGEVDGGIPGFVSAGNNSRN